METFKWLQYSSIVGKITLYLGLAFRLFVFQKNAGHGNEAIQFFALVISFFFFRMIWRQIYNLKDRYVQYQNAEIDKKAFKKKRNYSIGATVFLSLFVITIPFLIPHYIALSKLKI